MRRSEFDRVAATEAGIGDRTWAYEARINPNRLSEASVVRITHGGEEEVVATKDHYFTMWPTVFARRWAARHAKRCAKNEASGGSAFPRFEVD